jgi:hypothetical protein
MRPARWIAGMVLLTALAGTAGAEPAPYQATIKVPEAEVRSGHGSDSKLYATNRLRFGERVEVTKDLGDGWLEIMPPRRSFSWINARMVEPVSGNVYVVKGERGERVPVLYGSELREAKPTVEATRVPVGSQVVRIGKRQTADDGVWLPIEPPPTERRYVLAVAVVPPGTQPKTSPKEDSDTPLPPSAKWDGTGQRLTKTTLPTDAAGVPPLPGSDTGSSTTISDAQRAEQAGDFGTASKMWEELAKSYAKTNNDMAMNCHSHALWLRDRISSVANTNTASQNPARRLVPTPTAAYGASNRCQPTATPCGNTGGWRSYSPEASPGVRRETSPPPSARNVGLLKRAGWNLDNQTTYRLESSDGRTPLYVLPQSGVNLEPFVDRNVEVEGPVEYRTGARANCMMAKTVKPL